MKSDKQLATKDPSISLISFDLQQVLQPPYLSTNTLLYKSQLLVYNPCINEVATRENFMNMWPETEGGRDSEKVASRDTFKVHERRKNWGCKAYYCVLRHMWKTN